MFKSQAKWNEYAYRRKQLLKYPQRSAEEIGKDFREWYKPRAKSRKGSDKDLAVEVLAEMFREFVDMHGLPAAELFLEAADPAKK